MKISSAFACILFFIFSNSALQAQTPISGTFTVGMDGDYATVSEAVIDLQENGIGDGGLTLSLMAGVYEENIILENIDGTGPDSRLTLMGSTEGQTTIAGLGTTAGNEAVVHLIGMSYVTIENLRIEDGSTEEDGLVEFGIRFQGTAEAGCQYNEVRSCNIYMGPNGGETTNLTRGIRSTSAATEPAFANSYNLIEGTSIDNAGWGIQWSANASFFGALIQADTANSFINCTFGAERRIGHAQSSAAIGINVAGNRGLYIHNNVVDSVLNTDSDPTLPVSNSAFSFDNVSGELSNNRVHYVRYEGTIGSVYGVRASILENDTLLIKNNFISNISRSNFVGSTTDPSFSTVGIWIFAQDGGGGLARVLHNTIYMENDEAVTYRTAGFHLAGGSSGGFPAEVRNNIIVNNFNTSNADYSAYAIADGNSDPGFLTADYNNLIVSGANGFIGVIGQELGGVNLELLTLEDWIETSETGVNQISFPLLFENELEGNLRLSDDAETLEVILCPTLPEVPLDIDFEDRTAEMTHMGAHEGEMSTVSTHQSDRPEVLSVYPNPAVSEAVLDISPDIAGNYSIRMVDISGRVVSEESLAISANMEQIRLDVSQLTSGVYLIHIQGNDQIFVGKFVKE